MRLLNLAAFYAATEAVRRPLRWWSALIIGAFLLYLFFKGGS